VSERRLSKAEYERALRTPRRRYESFAIGGQGWALRGRVATPVFWFERNDVGEEAEGIYWRRPYVPVVTLMVDGWPAVLFYLTGKRLDSCTFAYNLTPERLTVAASVMRKVGLGRYIRPAAEWALKEVPPYNRAVLTPALLTLLAKLRSKRPRS
jgi:hypothetical protein